MLNTLDNKVLDLCLYDTTEEKVAPLQTFTLTPWYIFLAFARSSPGSLAPIRLLALHRKMAAVFFK